MIEKIGNSYDFDEQDFEVICDSCEMNDLEIFDSTWSDMIELLKEEGWKIFKDDDGDWKHFCPDCC